MPRPTTRVRQKGRRAYWYWPMGPRASGAGGFGAEGEAVGEVCFNTAMTGYQEVMTDPSYAGQIITFTFPHIGNVGANYEDLEADQRRLPRWAASFARTSPLRPISAPSSISMNG